MTDFPLHLERSGSGPAVVALHGGPGLGLQSFLPELRGADSFADLVLYDQRGCGRSPLAGRDAGDLDSHVADLELLRLQCGFERQILLGHSWGAYLALAYARRYPRRVRGLILVCPPLPYTEPADEVHRWYSFMTPAMRRAAGQLSLSTLPPEERINRRLQIVLPLYFHSLNGLEVFRSRVIRISAVYDERVVARLMDADLRPGLGALTMPTVIIAGAHDKRTPPHYARIVADALPQATFHLAAHSGHFPFLEEPASFLNLFHDALDRIVRETP